MPKLPPPPPAPAAVAPPTPSTVEKPSRVRVKQEPAAVPAPSPVSAFPVNPAHSEKARFLTPALHHILTQLERWDAKHQVFYLVPTDEEVPGYSSVVKRGMAFNLMRQNMARGVYEDISTFGNDVLLTVDNALAFNQPGTIVHKHALKLLREAKKLLLPHWPEMGPQAEQRLQRAEATKAAALAVKRASSAVSTGSSGAGASTASAVAAPAATPVGSAVSGGTGSKRARVSRRTVDVLDDEEDPAEAEEMLGLERYKGHDLSYLLPAAVGPLKVPGLGAHPLKRRYLYARLEGKAAGSTEKLCRETPEIASWRKKLYGEPSAPPQPHMVTRPLLAAEEEKRGVRRNYAVDFAEKVETDMAVRTETAPLVPSTTAKRQRRFPSKLPKSVRELEQAEERLQENAYFLHRLQLYRTWYPEAQLRVNEDYNQIVQQLEENLLALLGMESDM